MRASADDSMRLYSSAPAEIAPSVALGTLASNGSVAPETCAFSLAISASSCARAARVSVSKPSLV
jgi:hypothetical protein